MERFWSKVDKRGADECWPWLTRSTDRRGYGKFRLNGRYEMAHRVAFFLTNGNWPVPLGLHSCDSPGCCNPRHIRAGTHVDNEQDKISRGRRHDNSGEKNPSSKLTLDDIRQIREQSVNCTHRDIAERYGVCQQLVTGIINGRRWLCSVR